jgi:hypothetical protein
LVLREQLHNRRRPRLTPTPSNLPAVNGYRSSWWRAGQTPSPLREPV